VWKIPAIVSDGHESYIKEMHIPVGSAQASDPNSIGSLSELIPTTGMILRETPGDCESWWRSLCVVLLLLLLLLRCDTAPCFR